MSLPAESAYRQREGAPSKWMNWLPVAAIAAQMMFTTGWLVGGAVQGSGYSPLRHDISDAAALTARYPWVLLTAEGIAGLLTIVFAIGALRPSLTAGGRSRAIGAWLLAASAVALDNLSDAFFRLDCRRADPGCTIAASTASWHGEIHYAVGAVTYIALLAAPFVLARDMRRVEGWRRFASPSVGYGIVMTFLTMSYGLLRDDAGGGGLQRAIVAWASIGVIALALKVRQLAGFTTAPARR